MYRTTKEILTLADGGGRWRKGDPIAPGAVPDALWRRLIEEGAVVDMTPPSPGPARVDVTPTEATPRAAELAEELGVDLGQVNGSGEGGRILAGDVRDAANGESDD